MESASLFQESGTIVFWVCSTCSDCLTPGQTHTHACALPLPAALGGNLGGCTSFLLGLDDGQLASSLRLDLLVPVKGYKRCVDYQNGFGGAPAAAPAAM